MAIHRGFWRTAMAGSGLLAFAGLAGAHTDSLGFLISPDANNAGLYTAQIFYGSWHSSISSAEGALDLRRSDGTLVGTQTFVLGIHNQPNGTVPAGLVAGTNYFFPNSGQLTGSAAGHSIYGFQSVTFNGLAAGVYSFGYNTASVLSQVFEPSSPLINQGSFTITSSGQLGGVSGSAPSIPNIDTAQVLYTTTALASGAVLATFDGGRLQVASGTTSVANDFMVNATNGTIDSNGQAVTFSGMIMGAGALTINGGGTVTLTGMNAQNGLTVGAGTVIVSSDDNLGGGGVTIAGGTLSAAGGFATGKAVAITASNSTVDTGANTVTLDGAVSGTNALNKAGTGTLVLTGTNTQNGLAIGAGTVSVSTGNNLGLGTVTIGNGTLAATGNVTTGNAFAVTASNATLNTGANTVTLNGVVSGAGALNKAGTGTLVLNGINTQNGLTIGAGTVSVASGNNLGAGTVTIGNGTLAATGNVTAANGVAVTASNSTVDTGANTVTLSGAVSGVGALNKTGSGTLVLTGANTQNGLAIGAGTVSVSSGNNLGAGTVTIGNGTLAATGNVTAANGVAVTAANATVNTGANTVTLNGAVSGPGVLNKAGTGTLVLNGINTQNGLSIGAGTVAAAADANLGAGGVTIDNGTLAATGNLTSSKGVAVTAAASAVDTGANTVTLNGAVTGTGVLNKAGSGTLVLTGTNTQNGLNVGAGTVVASSDANLGAGGVSIGNGTLFAGGSFETAKALAVTHAASSLDTGVNTVTLTGPVSGAGVLNKAGLGTLVLTGANTQNGLSVGAGTVVASSDANLGGGDVSVGNGILSAAASFVTAKLLALTGTTSTIDTGANTLTLDGAVSGNGLTKTGTGTLVLTGTNTQAGLTIGAGTVTAAADANLGAGAVAIGNGTLAATGNLTSSKIFTLTDANAGIDTGANTVSLGGPLSGAGALNKAGSGTLVLTGANTQNGLVINAGAVQASADANLGAGGVSIGTGTLAATGSFASAQAFTMTSASAAIDTGANTLTLDGTVSGTGTLNKAGTGTLVLTGTNAQNGLVIGAGTVVASSDANLGAGPVTIGDGRLSAAASFATAKAITLAGTSSVIDAGANTLTLDGVLSGAALTKVGAGTLVLNGVNTQSGLAVAEGRVVASSDANLGAGNVTIGNATLTAGASFATAKSVALTDAASTIDTGAKTLTLNGAVTGAGALNKVGTGTLVLNGANAQKGLAIAAGTVVASSDAALGAGGVTVGNATLAASTGFTTAKAIALTSAASVIDTGGNTVTLNGTVSGAGTLNKQGTGTLVLTGTNSQNGVNIAGGTVAITSDAALGAATGVVKINETTTIRTLASFGIAHTFFINNTQQASIDTNGHDVEISGDITGSGIVQKIGSGTLTLSGSNSQVLVEVMGGSVKATSQAAIGNSGGDIVLRENANFNTTTNMTVSQNLYVTGKNTQFDTGANTVVLTGTSAGSACLTKTGSGTLDMRAASSNAIGACVQQGKLALNTSFTGNVYVDDAGTLGGNGVIYGDTQVSGTLSPGNSPGQLVFAGSVAQAAGSRLDLDIDGRGVGVGAGNYDTIVLTGANSVYTANGTIAPRLRGITGNALNTFTPVIGDRFQVITAQGGVNGAFTSLAQPTDGMPANSRFDVLYGSNAIILALTPNSYGAFIAGAGGRGNGASAAAALDGVRPDAASLALDQRGRFFNALAGLNQGQLVQAFQQVSGEIHNDAMDTVLMGNRAARSAVSRRLREGVENGATKTGATHFWGYASGAFGHVDADGRAQSYSNRVGSFVVGADRAIAADALVGGAFAANVSSTAAGILGESNSQSFQGYAYGRFACGQNFLNVIGGAGSDSYDIRRRVDLFGGSQALSARPDGYSVFADVEAGRRFLLGDAFVDAIAGVGWDHLGRAGFTERGSDLVALRFGSEDRDAVQGRFGFRLGQAFVINGAVVRPYAEAYLTQEFGDTNTVLNPILHGASFTTGSANIGRTGARVGAGLAATVAPNADVFVDYRANLTTRSDQQSVKVGLSVAW